jgi:hypothetical protein
VCQVVSLVERPSEEVLLIRSEPRMLPRTPQQLTECVRAHPREQSILFSARDAEGPRLQQCEEADERLLDNLAHLGGETVEGVDHPN